MFPIITDPKKDLLLQYTSGLRLQNQRLKRISQLYGIKNSFSTHSARHSWATVAKSASLPLAVISEGLGHTNQRTTEIYLASLERSVIDYASRVVSDAIIPIAPGKPLIPGAPVIRVPKISPTGPTGPTGIAGTTGTAKPTSPARRYSTRNGR
jgi:hypothetical protein